MKQSPGEIKLPPTLPVLTEVADENSTDIPTLTEIHTATEVQAKDTALDAQAQPAQDTSDPSVAPLSEAACQYLVSQIAPQIDALLREKLSLHFNELLLDAMNDVHAKLPEMIRSALDNTNSGNQND